MSDVRDQDRPKTSLDLSNPGELHRVLFEEAADGMFISDLHGRYVAVNQRGIELTGYSREELLGMNIADFIPPEDLARDPIRMDDLRQGKIIMNERRIRRKDGSLLPVEISTRMLPAGNILGIARDITERKRAERATSERNTLLTEINALVIELASLPGEVDIGDFVVGRLMRMPGARVAWFQNYDPEQRILALDNIKAESGLLDKVIHLLGNRVKGIKTPVSDQAYQKIVNSTVGKIKTLTEFSFGSIPAPVGTAIQAMAGVDRFFGLAHVIEGNLFGVSGLAMKADEPDPPAKLLESIAHLVAISLRRQSAEEMLRNEKWRLANIIEGTHVGTWEWNVQTGEIVFNKIWAQIIGYTLEELAPIRINTWKVFVHPIDRKKSDKVLQRHFAGELPYYDCEYRMRHKDGRWVEVHDRGKVVTWTNDDKPLMMFGTHSDITERKRAEEALLQNEEKYRQLIETTGTGYVIIDMQGRVIDANEEYVRLTGRLRLEDIIGHSVLDWTAPHELEHNAENIRKCVEQGFIRNLEIDYLTASGQNIPVEINATLLRTSGLHRILTLCRDISERKRAEEALRAHENLLSSIFRAAPTGIGVVSNRVLLEVNDRICEMTGRTQQELIGKNARVFYGSDADFEYVGTEKYRQIAERGTGTVETRWQCKDGSIIDVLLSSTPINPMDMAGGVTFTALDITERKRVEKELNIKDRAIASSFNAVAISDLNGKLTYVNDSFLRMWGYTVQEALNINATDLASDKTEITKIVKDIKEKGFSIGESVAIRNDGSLFNIQFSASLITNSLSEPIAMLSIFTDITERKKAEQEKEILQAQLLQAQKMESVGMLAGGVAHDFNNMLTTILGHTELGMMRCSPADRIYADLKAIENSALRSADLVRQLLAFARKQTIAPRILDVNDTVAGMLKMMRRLIGEDIDLVWKPGADLWPVMIDPSQVDQILANLCVNARDAIAGVGKVTIETANTVFDEAYCAVRPGFICGEYVMLAVSDDGCGMNKEVIEHLFEPFFTTKEMGKGTGLGLATMYGIVKQNAGFINVYSEPGQGSTFKIYLPRVAGATAEPITARAAEMPKGSGETVLLVEDQAEILNMGRAMLEHLGYIVLTAGTPGEALRQAETHADEIQLLISDVIMPEMNGRDLAKALRDIKPGLKCLFTSGYTANIIAHRGMLDEGVHFLHKPFSMNDLAFKVREALERD